MSFGGQPIRFSARRPGSLIARCVSAAAAQLQFAGKICMSADAVDASAFAPQSLAPSVFRSDAKLASQSKSPAPANAALAATTNAALSAQIAAVEASPVLKLKDSKLGPSEYGQIKKAMQLHALESTPNKVQSINPTMQIIPFPQKQPELIVYTVTPFAQTLANRSVGCKSIYRAFKLATPGHIAIALWNTEIDHLEIFDSSGIGTHTVLQQKLVEQLWPNPKSRPATHYVNQFSLQNTAYDMFCQTWIYIYLDLRVLRGKSPTQVVAFLHSLSPEKRFAYTTNYFDLIIKSGGHAFSPRAAERKRTRGEIMPPLSPNDFLVHFCFGKSKHRITNGK